MSTVYPNVDYDTMQYVDENGDRVRMQGRFPLPELATLAAAAACGSSTPKPR